MKSLRSATMLYRKGTEQRLHGVYVDTQVVDEHEIEEHLAAGWFRTPLEVKEAAQAEADAVATAAAAKASKVEKTAPPKD